MDTPPDRERVNGLDGATLNLTSEFNPSHAVIQSVLKRG